MIDRKKIITSVNFLFQFELAVSIQVLGFSNSSIRHLLKSTVQLDSLYYDLILHFVLHIPKF